MSFVLSRFRALELFDRLRGCGYAPLSIPPLGSVGVAACAVAMEITSGPVLTCALDFAYEGDKTHATGTPFPELLHRRATRLHPALSRSFQAMRDRPVVRGPDGTVRTDLVLQSYARTLEAMASSGRIHPLDADTARSVTAGSSDRRPAPEGTPARPAVFLSQEIELIEQALRAVILPSLARIQNGRARAGSDAPVVALSEEERAMLESVGYAACHFPDAGSEGVVPPDPSPSFLARFAQALRVYRVRMERLLARTREATA